MPMETTTSEILDDTKLAAASRDSPTGISLLDYKGAVGELVHEPTEPAAAEAAVASLEGALGYR